jgi:hypothetical protein
MQHEEIAKRAYELFLEDGCVHGRHEEHWFRAEQEVMTPAAKVTRLRAGV